MPALVPGKLKSYDNRIVAWRIYPEASKSYTADKSHLFIIFLSEWIPNMYCYEHERHVLKAFDCCPDIYVIIQGKI